MITTECSAVAELTIETAPPLVCAAGVYIANPELCGPLVWLNSNPAYKKIIKTGVDKGCTFMVDVGPKYYKIIVHDIKRGAERTTRTYNALNTPEGLTWLMNYMMGY